MLSPLTAQFVGEWSQKLPQAEHTKSATKFKSYPRLLIVPRIVDVFLLWQIPFSGAPPVAPRSPHASERMIEPGLTQSFSPARRA
jgi:hypothetical protein